jgi:hypothetical protein
VLLNNLLNKGEKMALVSTQRWVCPFHMPCAESLDARNWHMAHGRVVDRELSMVDELDLALAKPRNILPNGE